MKVYAALALAMVAWGCDDAPNTPPTAAMPAAAATTPVPEPVLSLMTAGGTFEAVGLTPGSTIIQNFDVCDDLAGLNLPVAVWAQQPDDYKVDWKVKDSASGTLLGSGSFQTGGRKDWEAVDLEVATKVRTLSLELAAPAGPPVKNMLGFGVQLPKSPTTKPLKQDQKEVRPGGALLFSVLGLPTTACAAPAGATPAPAASAATMAPSPMAPAIAAPKPAATESAAPELAASPTTPW